MSFTGLTDYDSMSETRTQREVRVRAHKMMLVSNGQVLIHQRLGLGFITPRLASRPELRVLETESYK